MQSIPWSKGDMGSLIVFQITKRMKITHGLMVVVGKVVLWQHCDVVIAVAGVVTAAIALLALLQL